MILANILGTLWWTILMFVAGGMAALVFRPMIMKMLNK
jgi:hypothetical protein